MRGQLVWWLLRGVLALSWREPPAAAADTDARQSGGFGLDGGMCGSPPSVRRVGFQRHFLPASPAGDGRLSRPWNLEPLEGLSEPLQRRPWEGFYLTLKA